jgi:hypothetical protein
MKKPLPTLNQRPTLFYWVLFTLMIVPGFGLFFATQAASQFGMVVLFGLVILANGIAVIRK